MAKQLRSSAIFLWLAVSINDVVQAQSAPPKAAGATVGVKISSDDITLAGIEVAIAGAGTLNRTLRVPGNVLLNPDTIAHVPAKVVGTVKELRKKLGDPVEKDVIVAILESREVADAKSELLTANANVDLQKTLFEKERYLRDSKALAENQFLRTENAFAVAKLRQDVARQKLSALDVDEAEIAGLSKQPVANLRRYSLRSPISGRIIERRVDLGAPVGGDQQEKEVYIVADLSSVWIELSVAPSDLATLREGESVIVRGDAKQANREATIVFIGPQLNKETRSARVILSMSNPERDWRAGAFVTAELPLSSDAVALLLPKAALQQIDGRPIVFVRSADGFEVRGVRIGRETEEVAEILSGLRVREQIAVSNTFVLKSDVGKSKSAD